MPQDIIFSIDKTNIQIHQTNGAYINDSAHYTDISDKVEISTRAFNKMTTSIPTPFARLYLYEGAIKTLITEEKRDVNGTNPNKGIAFRGNTINHYVVADALDMLEFLFEYGNDTKLKVEKWTVDDLQLLHTDPAPNVNTKEVTTEEKHNLLYESIKSNTIDGRLGGEFYIFKWCYKEDGYDLEKVIGATSPLTLVYTAPNWRTEKPQKFYGGRGNELFTRDLSTNVPPVALVDRSQAFREYLYALLANNDNRTPFFEYIKLTRDNYETIAGLIQNQFRNFNTDPTYLSINDADGLSISVGAVPLKLRNKEVLDNQCEFVIVPTANVLDEYTSGGEEVSISGKLPLVLSLKGIEGRERPHYWCETEFNRNNAELKIPSDKPYFERTLPNVPGEVKYPNLRVEDFFEDKIAKLSYNLDRGHFITGMNGNCQYLLPLKSTYFKFFKAEDLKKQLSIVEQGNGTVKATLTIPVRGRKTADGYAGAKVVLEKIYANNEQTQVKQIIPVNRFNLALFPFYRLEGTDSQHNCYEVMLGHDNDVTLEFFNDDINYLNSAERADHGRKCVKVESVRNRTTLDNSTYGITTTYYHLGDKDSNDGTFQFIVAKFANGLSAIIAPDWSKGKNALGEDKYVVSVDFGTTNTHIAYAKIDHDSNQVLTESITDMEYGRGSQVVTLNQHGSDGRFGQFGLFLQREFVPVEIGERSKVKFPIGTLIYEKSGKNVVKDLFGDMNIAFQLNEDNRNGLDESTLKSNIKWGNDPNSRNRIEAFFTEIMWMIKNKMVEIGGGMDFKFIFTFPQSMRGDVQGYMTTCWNDARKAVRAGKKEDNWSKNTIASQTQRTLMPYEGLTPWYSSYPDPNFGAQNSFLNIDIGGGTFDVVVVDSTTTQIAKSKSFSARFAANDLWGEGQNTAAKPENGFYNYYMSTNYCNIFKSNDAGFCNYYCPPNEGNGNNNIPRPSETIPYLFKHDRNGSEFSTAIRDNNKLRSLVLLHFSSIIYYVGRVLLLTESNCPTNIQFTGMGSLYINLITDDDETLTELVKTVLNYATGNTIEIPDGFKVWFGQSINHPKKITAQGALVMWNTTFAGNTEPVIDSQEVQIYGFEGDEDDPIGLLDNEVEGRKDAVMERMEHFLGVFNNPNFNNVISNIGFTDVMHLRYDNIKNNLSKSFDLMSQNNNASACGVESKEVIFFWPLKDAIHKLAINYAQSR